MSKDTVNFNDIPNITKIIVTTLTIVIGSISSIFGWWISNTHNKVNELQISQARSSEITASIEEKINASLELQEDLQKMTIIVARSQDSLEDLEQEVKELKINKFDISDYEKYIKPIIEELATKINRVEKELDK